MCADPDNLPLSNARGEGYENKIAEQLARDLGRQLEYTYFPQRMGFVRNTLRQKDPQTQQFKCDVIIGVPKGYELTATTRPYMRSTYALLFRHRPELESLADGRRSAEAAAGATAHAAHRRVRPLAWRRLAAAQRPARSCRDVCAAERRSRREPCAHHRARSRRRKDRSGDRLGTDGGFPGCATRRVPGLARGAVRAGSRDQVRLRDLDGRALRREGMEGHARPVDRHARSRACAEFSQAFSCRCSTRTAMSPRTSARPSACARTESAKTSRWHRRSSKPSAREIEV